MTRVSGAIQQEKLHPTDNVGIFRIYSDGSIERTSDKVVTEVPVTIMIDRVGSFTVMCTPSDIEALAIGFIFSEGMISSTDEVIGTHTKAELPNVVGIKIQDPAKVAIGRNLIVASSCGMCGVRNIEKMIQTTRPSGQTLRITSRLIAETMQRLRRLQHIFSLTGGSHGAAIFDGSGEIISFAEDIGRHNAMDKAIGKCLLAGRATESHCVALSGRVSLEMVAKAAKAGIELVAGVSAVSSYAVYASEKWNITLCGFVRPDKINVYTRPERVIDHAELG
ncbi:MAG: formate dehydrogenase accessory sulfurtransferase FdhD [Sedimentisphaerales bacterium]|jgi:FdhD protein